MKATKESACKHEEVTPMAIFLDDFNGEAMLYQVCQQCGDNFLLLGNRIKNVG